jgi:hypothetical protein
MVWCPYAHGATELNANDVPRPTMAAVRNCDPSLQRNSPVQMTMPQFVNLLKSILHNTGVVVVGFGVAYAGKWIDSLLWLGGSASAYATGAGALLLAAGFSLRVWATFYFYRHRMKVISLAPQDALITGGVSLLAQSALPWRQRLHLLWRELAGGIARRACYYSRASAAGRLVHQARGAAIGSPVRSGLGGL